MTYRGDEPLRADLVNGHGVLEETSHGCASIESEWKRGEIVRQNCRNRLGALYRIYEFAQAGLRETIRAPSGRERATGSQEYTRIQYLFDEEGYATRLSYFDHEDRPAPSFDGAVAADLTRRPDGLVTSRSKVDAHGQPHVTADGVHRVVYVFDDRKRITQIENYDLQGRLVPDEHGVAVEVRRFDAHGNPLEYHYLSAKRQPILHGRDGAAVVRLERNQHGDLLVSRYFDVDGKHVKTKSGYASVAYSVDDRGQTTGVRYLDARGQLVNGVQGYAELRYTLDERGLVLERRAFDDAGAPVDHDGAHVWRRSWDTAGNATQSAYFDVQGKPTKSEGGYHKSESTYDVAHDSVTTAYFDVEGKPFIGADGWSKVLVERDPLGRVIARNYYVQGSELRVDNFAREELAYDAEGRVVERAYFDGMGQAFGKEWAVIRYGYDEQGRVTRYSYLRDRSTPAVTWLGISGLGYGYDAQDRIVSSVFYDALGERVDSVRGYAETRYDYAAPPSDGEQPSVAYYDAAGNPVEVIALKTLRFCFSGADQCGAEAASAAESHRAATAAQKRLRAGESIASVAKQSGAFVSDLEAWRPDQLREEFRAAIGKLEVGQTSAAVKTSAGYYLLHRYR